MRCVVLLAFLSTICLLLMACYLRRRMFRNGEGRWFKNRRCGCWWKVKKESVTEWIAIASTGPWEVRILMNSFCLAKELYMRSRESVFSSVNDSYHTVTIGDCWFVLRDCVICPPQITGCFVWCHQNMACCGLQVQASASTVYNSSTNSCRLQWRWRCMRS